MYCISISYICQIPLKQLTAEFSSRNLKFTYVDSVLNVTLDVKDTKNNS